MYRNEFGKKYEMLKWYFNTFHKWNILERFTMLFDS